MPQAPSRLSLQGLIEGCGLRLQPAQYDALWVYHGMLRAANAELNLTRIHNFESMVLKHYVDSLLVLKFTELPSPLVDMGTGPGLPGIPLKIARPDIHMILAEPRGARVAFLRAVCERLNLRDVEVYGRKVGSNFPQQVRGIITRAVATIPETLDRAAACLEPGGQMLFMKGPDCGEEIAEAARSHAGLFRLRADHAYHIPGTTHDRRLVIYERTEAPVVRQASAPTPTVAYAGPVREVTSEANPAYKQALDLLSGRGIRKHGKAILAGPRPIAEVLARYPDRVEAWLTDSEGPPPPESEGDRPTWLRLADPLFKTLDTSGTRAPLLLVKTPALPEWSDDESWPLGCTLFIPFQDPENVGALLRSAAAFGVARVVLLREAAHPFHPRSARAAGTALFQVALSQGPSLRDLNCREVPLIALDAEGTDIDSEPFPERFGLVPGVEGPGLPEHLRAGPRRRIPMASGVESLNAAVATAVALYVWRTARRESGAES